MSEQVGHKQLLAGHAPAVIVGGKRVGGITHSDKPKPAKDVNNNTSSDEEKKTAASADDSLSTNSSSEKNNNKLVNQNKGAGMIVNGQLIDVKDAFPTESVKHFQEKPLAAHENGYRLPTKKSPGGAIFQPRSYNQPPK